jgi:hypothetical protein
MTSEHLWQLEQNEKHEWAAQEPLFTDREWFEAKMFGQYEQRENREEVVVFRRIDLASYVSMIRTYDAELVAEAEREACAKVCDNLIMYGPVTEAQQRYNKAYADCRDKIRDRGIS